MKKYILIIAALIAVFLFSSVALAVEQHPATLDEAIKVANKEVAPIYGFPDYFQYFNIKSKPINKTRWMEKDRVLFAYGEPFGDVKDDRYRYIGETIMGEDFTNPYFPHDAWAGGKLESRKWIPEPWDIDSIQTKYNLFPNKFNNRAEYLPSIQRGLELFYADAIQGPSNPMWNHWHEYLHILQPPTKWAWGLGRMWHQVSSGENKGIWYITIPLPPMADTVAPDLSTNLETNSFSNVKPGDKITSTVAYKLNPDHPRPERAWLRLHHIVNGQEYSIQLQPVNGAPAPDEKGYITLQPGDVKVYGYTFTVQDTPTKILSRINPVDTKEDKNWDNNRAEAEVKIPAYDISVKIKPDKKTFTAINGDKTGVAFKIYVTRKDNIPGEIHVTGSYKGKTGTYSINTALGPGESEVMPYGFPGTPGSYTVEAEAWPVGADDIYPPDNRDRVTVTVSNQKLESDGGLHVELLDGGPIYSR
ncbi:MAG: hypothetical protein M1130_12990 [Actinobacteria bacterium]|nr:hypothetical protein [Actinomycetota bacterium]